jgi:hypothetical protein
MTSTNQTNDRPGGDNESQSSGSSQKTNGRTFNTDLDDVDSLRYALFGILSENDSHSKAQISSLVESTRISAVAIDKMAEGQLILIRKDAAANKKKK